MFIGFAVCVLAAASASPNIVWIWFDDLGIGDVSFMGGDLPTPILDALVVDKSVKLNFHYSESVCAPARSSFLTGRYAFKSGLNTIVWPFSALGFNEQANVLLSQILKDSGSYNNLIAGQWHIGHDREARLPQSNGFNAGLYSLFGAGDYSSPQFKFEELEDLDEAFGPEPYFDGPVQEARDALFPDGDIQMHHLYRLAQNKNGNGYAKSALVEEPVFAEDLFVDEIKSFIAAQDDSQTPFFVYYSLNTAHSTLAEPPLTRNGNAVNYSVCTDAFPSENNCTDVLGQCRYCSQIHYGSIGVQDIVDSIKINPNIEWDNTVIIISSANGPATGTAPGSAMPLRGRKAGVFEGGIRTPAFMIGGLVEKFTTSRCEYNEIVHVSDWYHVFMDMIGTVSDDYSPDADHSQLGIWQNIQCQCGAADAVEEAQCNADNAPRTEVITMISCSGSTPFMHNTAIIKDGYKLIVNGAVGAGRLCPSRFRNAATKLTQYNAPPDTLYAIPNTEYYENWYLGARGRMGSELFDTVFGSTCLDYLYENNDTASMDNAQYPPFQYDTYLLYDLANDRVEGCAMDLDDPINAAKRDELLAVLEAAAVEYDSPSTDVTPLRWEYAAFQSMIESFDCEDPGAGSVYLPTLWTDNPANLTDYETLWQRYIDEYSECQPSDSSD